MQKQLQEDLRTKDKGVSSNLNFRKTPRAHKEHSHFRTPQRTLDKVWQPPRRAQLLLGVEQRSLVIGPGLVQ